jgi:YegS/Rv2252/BmrU family lipid kinase
MADIQPRDGHSPADSRHEVLVLTNPQCLAKHGLSPADVEEAFAPAGLAVEVRTLDPEATAESLRDAIEEGAYNLVVAAGGDGTVHMVANALAGTGRPMGVLPLGTANDFARTLGIPTELHAAVRVIAENAPVPVDLGRVNGVYFLNAGHVGLGVETAKRTNPTLKKVIGPFAYMLAAAQAWMNTDPMPITICNEGDCLQIQAAQLLVGNGRYFGGGMQIAKDATLDDGLLDVYVLSADLGKAELLKMAAALRMGTLGEQEHILYYRTSRLSATLGGPVQINVDGEVLAMEGRLDFEVVPRALGVYAPAPATLPVWASDTLTAEPF